MHTRLDKMPPGFRRLESYKRPWHVDMLDTVVESYHSAFFFDGNVCRSFPPEQRVLPSFSSGMKPQVDESGGRGDQVFGRGETSE